MAVLLPGGPLVLRSGCRRPTARRPTSSGTALEALASSTALVSYLRTHRLQCFEIRRRRRLGLPVPDARARRARRDRGERDDGRAVVGGPRGILRPHALDEGLRARDPLSEALAPAIQRRRPSRRRLCGSAEGATRGRICPEVGEPSIFEDIIISVRLAARVDARHRASSRAQVAGRIHVSSTRELLIGECRVNSGVPGLLTLPDDVHALHDRSALMGARAAAVLDLVDVAALTSGRDRAGARAACARVRARTHLFSTSDRRGGRSAPRRRLRPTLAGLTGRGTCRARVTEPSSSRTSSGCCLHSGCFRSRTRWTRSVPPFGTRYSLAPARAGEGIASAPRGEERIRAPHPARLGARSGCPPA